MTDSNTHKPELKKVLSAFDLVMMGVGCIIGVGIYVLSGVVAADYAGPGIILSFIIAAIICSVVGLCYSELASIIPIAGSAYSYTYFSLGRFWGWFIGWMLILEYLVAASAVACGWSAYFQKFMKDVFHQPLPEFLTNVPGSLPDGAFSINLFAVIIMILITAISIRGMRESATFNNIIAILKVLVLLFFVGFCVWFVDTSNWFPLIPERVATIKDGANSLWEMTLINLAQGIFAEGGLVAYLQENAKFWHYGVQGIVTGAALIFFTYVGFDMVSSMSEESKNPQKDIPIGIIGSLGLVTGVYILVTLVLIGIIPPVVDGLPNQILVGSDSAAPLSIGIGSVTESTWPSLILSLGALAGVTTTLLALNLALSRILLAISRDGFLPGFLSKVHPKFQTPYVATIAISIVVSIFAAVLPIGKLAQLCNLGTLAAFIFVCFAVIVLRKRYPNHKRSFTCPFVPIFPIFGMICCAFLMISLSVATWAAFAVWLFLGACIYYGYSRHWTTEYPKHNTLSPQD